MIKAFLLLWIFTYAGDVHACTCRFTPLDTESARAAKDVFVFRLVQAKVRRGSKDAQAGSELLGQIQIIDRLRGTQQPPAEITFSTASCCGSRLDVGSYFVAFVSDAGSRFVANRGNVMEVGREYSLRQTRAHVLAVLNGKEELDAVFSREFRDRTEQSPVLPPRPR